MINVSFPFCLLRKQISKSLWKSRVIMTTSIYICRNTFFEFSSHFLNRVVWLLRICCLMYVSCVRLIEIRRRCSATLFSHYSFAKSWRHAGERCFAFAVVVPACFADRLDRSWILAYHVVLSGPLIVTSRYTLQSVVSIRYEQKQYKKGRRSAKIGSDDRLQTAHNHVHTRVRYLHYSVL